MKTQPLWDTVPFSLLRQTPSPRGSPALGGWGRTENPDPVGRSLSWENSTGRHPLPSRKAGRPGSRGVSGGVWPGDQRLLTFLSFRTRALLSQTRPRRRRPPSLGLGAGLRPPPSCHPGHVLQRPSPHHRHRHSPEAMLLAPGGVCGRMPARVGTKGKLGSQGRGGGLNPDLGQVAPRPPALALRRKR